MEEPKKKRKVGEIDNDEDGKIVLIIPKGITNPPRTGRWKAMCSHARQMVGVEGHT